MTKYTALGASVLLVGIDQLIKIWAQQVLSESHRIVVIPGLFNLTYVRNYGAAFGILQGMTALLTVLVSVVLVGALYLLLSGKIRRRFLVWAVSLVIAGGVGNLIDRVMYGYVVDYLDFSALFGFPVFNFADCCVVIGTLLILIYVLFLEQKPEKAEATKVVAAGEGGTITMESPGSSADQDDLETAPQEKGKTSEEEKGIE